MKVVAVLAALVVVAGDEAPLAKAPASVKSSAPLVDADLHEAPLVELHRALSSVHCVDRTRPPSPAPTAVPSARPVFRPTRRPTPAPAPRPTHPAFAPSPAPTTYGPTTSVPTSSTYSPSYAPTPTYSPTTETYAPTSPTPEPTAGPTATAASTAMSSHRHIIVRRNFGLHALSDESMSLRFAPLMMQKRRRAATTLLAATSLFLPGAFGFRKPQRLITLAHNRAPS